VLMRVPRFRTYRMKKARPNNTTDRPIKTGASHPASAAAAPPANPSRDSTPAVVQVGAAPTAANKAPVTLASLSFITHFLWCAAA
jgi:hypothetical protein